MVVVSDANTLKIEKNHLDILSTSARNLKLMLPYLIGVFLFYIMQKYCDSALEFVGEILFLKKKCLPKGSLAEIFISIFFLVLVGGLMI